MFQRTKRMCRKAMGFINGISTKVKMLAIMLLSGTTAMAQNSAGDYSAGTSALSTVAEEINFGVNPTKYNTCIKSYLSNNNTSYTMNYSRKVNFNNT